MKTELYRGLQISAIAVETRFKPIITDWRNAETIKTNQTSDSPQGAIALAKSLIDFHYS